MSAAESFSLTPEALADPVALVGRDGKCLAVNPAFAKLGITHAIGKRLELLAAEEGRETRNQLRNALKNSAVRESSIYLEEYRNSRWKVVIVPLAADRAAMIFLAGGKDLAYVDALTGLPNRRDGLHQLEIEWARTLRNEGKRFSLALADIDHFKQINDRYGHEVGDQCLKAVAKRLKAVLRKGDWCARWGGEEFLIFLYSTASEKKGGLAGCERARKSVCSRPFITSSGSQISLAVSMGVVDSNMYRKGGTVQQMFADADMLMYEAKAAGRNRTCVNEAGAKLFWQREEIRNLLRDDGLEVVAESAYPLGKKDESCLFCAPRLIDGDKLTTMRLLRAARLQEMLQEIENHWFATLAAWLADKPATTIMAPISSPSLLVFERLLPIHEAIGKISDLGHRLVLLARANEDIAIPAVRSVKDLRIAGAEFGLRSISLESVPVELIERLQPINILLDPCKEDDIRPGVRQALETCNATIFLYSNSDATAK
ncbi:MAG: GGDEF domain-containing protein [Betaproteobacteria bacterium]|nr:GGDEF domain-containing protein [Betaproteobacteria bacterium]